MKTKKRKNKNQFELNRTEKVTIGTGAVLLAGLGVATTLINRSVKKMREISVSVLEATRDNSKFISSELGAMKEVVVATNSQTCDEVVKTRNDVIESVSGVGASVEKALDMIDRPKNINKEGKF